jgi:hypothetical protein
MCALVMRRWVGFVAVQRSTKLRASQFNSFYSESATSSSTSSGGGGGGGGMRLAELVAWRSRRYEARQQRGILLSTRGARACAQQVLARWKGWLRTRHLTARLLGRLVLRKQHGLLRIALCKTWQWFCLQQAVGQARRNKIELGDGSVVEMTAGAYTGAVRLYVLLRAEVTRHACRELSRAMRVWNRNKKLMGVGLSLGLGLGSISRRSRSSAMSGIRSAAGGSTWVGNVSSSPARERARQHEEAEAAREAMSSTAEKLHSTARRLSAAASASASASALSDAALPSNASAGTAQAGEPMVAVVSVISKELLWRQGRILLDMLQRWTKANHRWAFRLWVRACTHSRAAQQHTRQLRWLQLSTASLCRQLSSAGGSGDTSSVSVSSLFGAVRKCTRESLGGKCVGTLCLLQQ